MSRNRVLFMIRIFVLRTKEVKSVKVQWKHHPIEEATWETEKDMQDNYTQLFTNSGTTLLFP